ASALPSGGNWNIVFAYFQGGWDILLSLDPRDPVVFSRDVLQDTRIDPGYDSLIVPSKPDPAPLATSVPSMMLGPFMEPLVPFADRMSIVRGMSMETLTHEVGRRRFITGRPPSGLQARGSSIATVLAAQIGHGVPIPNLSANVETYNVDQPSYASALKVATVSDLVRSLSPGAVTMDDLQQERIDDLLEAFRECESTQRSIERLDALDLRAGAHSLVAQNLDERFDFLAPTPEMADLRARYGITNNLATPEAQAAMAATALVEGISRVVSFTATESLDTHYTDWQTLQGPRQERGFSAIAALATDLASRPHPDGGSWLDKTIIVGFSEFCRTALLNANGGRDHSLTNACFLLGGGVVGGQVIGASSDVGMSPTTTDLVTGLPSASGEILKPEHVMRALLERVGLTDDVADLRVPALSALLA
ncbi:MAG: DUF1501 domain-containing protein, partial [Myxococcales bacterium]|nr:DUF1501 domain-containing protein [Myxococcales bacterium]